MCKNTAILKNVLFNHLPSIFPNQEDALKWPKAFNVEHLVEIAMEEVNGHKFVDANGYDHEDFTETKTTSVWGNTFQSNISAKFEISNVGRYGNAGHGEKMGDIRLIVYNPWIEEVAFFFLPKDWWTISTITIHPTSQTGKNNGRWNSQTGEYFLTPSRCLNKFRCVSFEELAMIPAGTTLAHFLYKYKGDSSYWGNGSRAQKKYFAKYPQPGKTFYDFFKDAA